MEREYFLAKTTELPTCFARRLFQGSMLCTIVLVRLPVRISFEVMYCVERQI